MERTIISDLRQQISALHKRRLLIAACVAAGLFGAALYNSLVRPLYQATAVLLLETETPNLLGARSVLERRRTLEALNTQFQMLKSRRLAESVVTQLDLKRHPEFLSGCTARSHGFHGVPRWVFVPKLPIANSTVCVLPRTIMPAAMSREASVAVTDEMRSLQAFDPPVVTRPSSSTMSLSAIGTPWSGPTRWPERIARSALSAARRASAS